MNTKRPLKILIPLHTLPTIPLVHTRIIESILPYLEKKYTVELNWFVYTPNKIKLKSKKHKILDIHNYSNAVEVIKDTKPDIIYTHATSSLDPHFAISLAAKFLNIPVFSGIWADRWLKTNNKKQFLSYITQFLENRERMKFFIFKIFFVNNTLKVVGFSKLESILKLYKISKKYFKNNKGYDPEFPSELHWLENNSLFDEMDKLGYKKDSLVVTGNPLYDLPIKRIRDFKYHQKTNKKIQVLFVTSLIAEHGIWTVKQRDEVVKKVVGHIATNKKFNLEIKISSLENYSKYSSLVHSIDKNIRIYQDGDFMDYLEKADVVISFSGVTSVAIFTLLARKPLIITNFFNSKGDKVLENEIAMDCQNPLQLTNLIQSRLEKNNEEKIEKFINETFYKEDGNASERLSKSLINLIEKNRIES
jgi:hypothetical protein